MAGKLVTRVAAAGLLALIVVAAGWLWRARPDAGLLGELDGAHTVATLELRQLDQLAPHLPEAALSLLAQHSVTAKDPQSWRRVGLDARHGLAWVLDDRAVVDGRPLPLLLLPPGSEPAALQQALGQGKTWWQAPFGEGTLLAELPAAWTPTAVEALRTQLSHIAQMHAGSENGTKLKHREDFARAVEASGEHTALAWVNLQAAVGLRAHSERTADLRFWADLFPSGTLWLGDAVGAHLTTTESAARALRDVAVPGRNPPRCAQLWPKTGWLALRTAVNPVDVLTGIGALLPPSTPPQVRTALPMAGLGLAMVGLSQADLAQAFSGHLCAGVAVPGSLQGPPDGWLVAAGLVDPVAADALVAQLAQRMQATAVTVAGRKGWQFQKGTGLTSVPSLVVVRGDGVLLAAPSVAQLQAALGRPVDQSLAAVDEGRALDEATLFSAVVDLSSVRPLVAPLHLPDGTVTAALRLEPGDQQATHVRGELAGTGVLALLRAGTGAWLPRPSP